MSSPLEYPLDIAVSEAPADARAAFIRRTYGHLAGAVLAFVALETFLLTCVPGIERIIAPMRATPWSWMGVLLLYMAVSWVAQKWACSECSRGVQYLGLSLYVVAEVVIFLPVLVFATYDMGAAGPKAVQSAGILTLAAFGGLTAVAFTTRKDYSAMGPILKVALMLALGFIFASFFIGFSHLVYIIFAFVMVAVACGCIIYETSNIIHHCRTDQHVGAATCLFASLALLFWYVLQIALMFASEGD